MKLHNLFTRHLSIECLKVLYALHKMNAMQFAKPQQKLYKNLFQSCNKIIKLNVHHFYFYLLLLRLFPDVFT